MTILNQHAEDLTNGWIETDPDSQQRILPPSDDDGHWTIRQKSTLYPLYAIEAVVWISDLSEGDIDELLEMYGYEDSIRKDERFNQILVEMEFETTLINQKEQELHEKLQLNTSI
ncbi:hypothetical protein [Vibrio sp. D431a]|uniref:hypothetical protein n=1 Tax=Vibrio sp. D431a TaxID=2837388 RepID=UPI002553EA85|nr:hypothetical protein [Vibrio sp. D431a]MDK9793691.1 hypothetical protein [Vibrio sp. D431a]